MVQRGNRSGRFPRSTNVDRENPFAEQQMMEWEREAEEAEALAAMRADDEAAAQRALDAQASAEAEERDAR